MKILIVSAQLPHPGRGGANVRNYYLLKALDNPSMRIALGNAGRALVEASTVGSKLVLNCCTF